MAFSYCKCCECKNPLLKPVQLCACMHILCNTCCQRLESKFNRNINCPKCGMENAKPSSLNIISGIDQSNNSASGSSDILCDTDANHGKALYSCFPCGKNLCSSCRVNSQCTKSQQLKHNVSLFANATHLETVFNEMELNVPCEVAQYEDPVASGGLDHVDSGPQHRNQLDSLEPDNIQCPMCKVTDCQHIELIEQLEQEIDPKAPEAYCRKDGHVADCSNEPLPNNYFCLKCNIPVCEKCSKAGNHKLCDTIDLIDLQEYLETTVQDLKNTTAMLISKASLDEQDERKVKGYLQKHVERSSDEMDKRKCRVLEEVTHIFNSAVEEAKREGRDIVRVYRDNLKETIACCQYLGLLSQALDIEVDEKLNTAQYITLLNRLNAATQPLQEIKDYVKRRSRPKEMRLVLSGLDALSPCRSAREKISSVRKECKEPPLAFSFPLCEGVHLVYSMAVIGSDECILTCAFASSGYDSAIHYKDGSSKVIYDYMKQGTGRCYLARLNSGEVVAVFHTREKSYQLKYCRDEKELSTKFERAFTNITSPTESGPQGLVPRGIAATKQNTILLCMAAFEDGKIKKASNPEQADQRMLMLMSLQGKMLRIVAGGRGNPFSPNCVAVSEEGEVCLCDRENSSIILFDKDLKNETRLAFRWPTSLSREVITYINQGIPPTSDNFTFRPESVCYDRYGRILVADSNNHAVVRICRAPDDHQCYMMEPIIVAAEGDKSLMNFKWPTLLSLGQDGRLWVVCRSHVYVFNYGV